MPLLRTRRCRLISHLREESYRMVIRPASDPGNAPSKVTLKQERCPKCHALLFRADAEGAIEIKCRKCGYVLRRELRRGDMVA